MKVELSLETLDGIVVDFLKEEYKTLKINLEDEYTHPEDLKVYKKTRKAIATLLKFYMIRDEAKQFIEENK